MDRGLPGRVPGTDHKNILPFDGACFGSDGTVIHTRADKRF